MELARYCGAQLVWIRCINKQSLYLILLAVELLHCRCHMVTQAEDEHQMSCRVLDS